MAVGKKVAAEEQPSVDDARQRYHAALDTKTDALRKTLIGLADTPPQVLLFEGGTPEERVALAHWQAALLNCSHAVSNSPPCLSCAVCLQIGAELFHDVFVFDGREGSIGIEAVRGVRTLIGEAPRSQGYRVIVLAEAQSLGIEAANALLKVLEEPRSRLCFVITTPQRERLLPTLVSRSWVFTLPWPALNAIAHEHLQDWVFDLSVFLKTGRQWFARTSTKGAMDNTTAQQLLAFLQKTLACSLTDPKARPNPLSPLLAQIPHTRIPFVLDAIHQAQHALHATVNPTLVMDWLVTRLYLATQKQ